MPKQRKLQLPRLAEPSVGDRIATRFDGSLRYGRVRDRYLGTFHVEFENEVGKVHRVDATELWKVKNADPR